MTIESGLQEGQVLQRLGARGANARLTGTCAQNGPVLASITGRKGVLKGWKNRRIGVAARGKFTSELKAIPAGGPYRLQLQVGPEKITLREFFVGDVWLMAGQSNMEGVGEMNAPAKPHPLIRAFSMRREWKQAVDPLHLLGESPDACHCGSHQFTPAQGERAHRRAKKGVSVGIFFAREMMRHSGVPQGLIATAHGGTSMNQWSPDLKDKGGDSLYGSMFLSLRATAQPIAGVIWYQGESDANVNDTPHYNTRMKAFVAAVRKDLRQPALPWVIVQISRVCGDNRVVDWNSIQEQQRLLPSQIKRLEMVAAIDLPLNDGVHIASAGFARLGPRMASAMRSVLAGGKNRPPQLRAIVPVRNFSDLGGGPSFDIVYDSVEGGLRSGDAPNGFTLVNAEGKVIHIHHKTALLGNVVRITLSRSQTEPLFLHYGHGIVPFCNITDARDFSLPVFGPLPIFQPAAYLPFVTTWKTTGITATTKPLEKIACPDLDMPGATIKDYSADVGASGFINEHSLWYSNSGHAYFTSIIDLPERMRLRFLMGYDGAFRLWVDGKPLYADLTGTTPCFADQGEKKLSLAKGKHRITVAMDIEEGKAWGFMLRFIRDDIRPAQLEKHDYPKPSYSA